MPDILIVEDETAVAMVLEELLISNGFQVVGVASSGSEAISMAERFRPDLVLMDIKLEGKMDGIDAAMLIRQKIGVNSLFLTGHSDAKLIKRASEALPLGYLLKPLDSFQILAAVKIACHMVNLSRQTEWAGRKNHLDDGYGRLPAYLPEELSALTSSELKVAALIIQGLQTKQIAATLNLSFHTIEWHRGHIRKKLGLLDRNESLMLHLLSLV